MPNPTQSSKRAILALIALAVIWGYNWVVMKVAVQDSPPFDFAALRAFLGAVSLFMVMLVLRKPLKPTAIGGTCLYGILHSGGTTGLATWALVSGGAGKTAILTYTMSFWTVLFARIFLRERIKGQRWFSLGLALVGLVFILIPFSFSSGLWSKGLATLAGISWALSSIVAKKLEQHHPLELLSFTAWQMLFGSLPLIAVSLLVPDQPIQWTASFIWALLYNVIPGSAIAWLLWLYALKHLPAGTVGLGSLATPVVGVLSASLQLGESPSPSEWIGIVLLVIALLLNSIHATHHASQATS